MLSSGGSVYNPFGYTGEYTDAESGFIYLRARYYDPSTQQFLTVDPALAWTEQAYAYVAGSPTKATDPMGLAGTGRPGSYSEYAKTLLGRVGLDTLLYPRRSLPFKNKNMSSTESGMTYVQTPRRPGEERRSAVVVVIIPHRNS